MPPLAICQIAKGVPFPGLLGQLCLDSGIHLHFRTSLYNLSDLASSSSLCIHWDCVATGGDTRLMSFLRSHHQVFFIRDGIKFPDMVHALKPNPKNHIQENWRIADFFSHIPESMHMVRLVVCSCESCFAAAFLLPPLRWSRCHCVACPISSMKAGLCPQVPS